MASSRAKRMALVAQKVHQKTEIEGSSDSSAQADSFLPPESPCPPVVDDGGAWAGPALDRFLSNLSKIPRKLKYMTKEATAVQPKKQRKPLSIIGQDSLPRPSNSNNIGNIALPLKQRNTECKERHEKNIGLPVETEKAFNEDDAVGKSSQRIETGNIIVCEEKNTAFYIPPGQGEESCNKLSSDNIGAAEVSFEDTTKDVCLKSSAEVTINSSEEGELAQPHFGLDINNNGAAVVPFEKTSKDVRIDSSAVGTTNLSTEGELTHLNLIPDINSNAAGPLEEIINISFLGEKQLGDLDQYGDLAVPLSANKSTHPSSDSNSVILTEGNEVTIYQSSSKVVPVLTPVHFIPEHDLILDLGPIEELVVANTSKLDQRASGSVQDLGATKESGTTTTELNQNLLDFVEKRTADEIDDLWLQGFNQAWNELEVNAVNQTQQLQDNVQNVESQQELLTPASANQDQSDNEESDRQSEGEHPEESEGRKRMRKESTWKRNQAKRCLDFGLEHVNSKGNLTAGRQMASGCKPDLCRFKCHTKISENDRQLIFKQFWGLGDHTRQWDFVNKHTNVVPTTASAKGGKARSIFRKYFLYVERLPVRVCRTMFLSTLDISESWVKTAHKKLGTGHIISPDKRGKNPKISPDVRSNIENNIKAHIRKIKCVPSHFCRARTKRKYLDSKLSIKKMYKLYQEWMAETKPGEKICAERKYRQIFNENFNLGFHQPKKDLCETCQVYENAPPEVKARLKASYDEHRLKKEESRSLKIQDKQLAKTNKQVCFAVFDLQKTLILPKCEIGPVYYSRKLSAYNLTVWEGVMHLGVCYVWDESEGKKGANEVASALYHFMETMVTQHQMTEFRLWSDNCTGQNKNKYLYAMYTMFSAKFNVKIYHRYLDTGHTQSECDNVHSLIERTATNKSFFVPEQWYDHIRTAKEEGLPYRVEKLHDKIYDFHTLADKFQWKMPIKNVREIFVDPEHKRKVFIKKEFKDDYEEFSITKGCGAGRPFEPSSFALVSPYTGPLSLPDLKLRDLAKLCQKLLIPPQFHEFYEKLKNFPQLNIPILQAEEDEENNIEYDEENVTEDDDRE